MIFSQIISNEELTSMQMCVFWGQREQQHTDSLLDNVFIKHSSTNCKVQHSRKHRMSHSGPFIRPEQRVFVISVISLRFLSGDGCRDISEVSLNDPSFQDKLHHVLDSHFMFAVFKSVWICSPVSFKEEQRAGRQRKCYQRCVLWTSLTDTTEGLQTSFERI